LIDPEYMFRDEQPGEQESLVNFASATFRADSRAELLNRLRPLVRRQFSLIAEHLGFIIGHALFVQAFLRQDQSTFLASGIGTLAVHPNYRRQGIGSRMLDIGLGRCQDASVPLVFALTEPAYYLSRGFEFASKHGYHYHHREFDTLLLVKEIIPGSLARLSGEVSFIPAP